MEFETLEEAVRHQVLCGTCGKPKRALVGIHKFGVPSRYVLVRCKQFRCATHCQKASGCSHVLLPKD